MTVGDHIHELKVMSEYPAFDVFIRFENDSEAVFSDNFFDLMPERPEIIRIESNKSISDLHEGLKVRSWYGSSDAKNKLPAR